MMKICALIPSYNESRTIGPIVAGLCDKGLTAYVVDDGSTDNTAGLAHDAGAVVVQHKMNLGKGASLREGFRHVIKKGYDAVIVMDGDGQHLIDDVGKFVAEMESSGADMVIGNRMDDVSTMPADRKWTNRFMSGLISAFAGQKVPDSQSGYRLIRTIVLEKIHLKSSNFEIETELIIEAARSGFKIGSVPIKAVYRDEKSNINPVIDTFRFVIFMIRMIFSR